MLFTSTAGIISQTHLHHRGESDLEKETFRKGTDGTVNRGMFSQQEDRAHMLPVRTLAKTLKMKQLNGIQLSFIFFFSQTMYIMYVRKNKHFISGHAVTVHLTLCAPLF